MSVQTRTEAYWEDLILESEIGFIRYSPPDEGIPVPSEDDRERIRDARRRYVVASGIEQPKDSIRAARAERDRKAFREIFSMPEDEIAEEIDTLDAIPSIFAHKRMAEFVVAVSGLDFETYIAVTYEDMVITLNRYDYSYVDYVRFVETEYVIATELLCAIANDRLAA